MRMTQVSFLEKKYGTHIKAFTLEVKPLYGFFFHNGDSYQASIKHQVYDIFIINKLWFVYFLKQKKQRQKSSFSSILKFYRRQKKDYKKVRVSKKGFDFILRAKDIDSFLS